MRSPRATRGCGGSWVKLTGTRCTSTPHRYGGRHFTSPCVDNVHTAPLDCLSYTPPTPPPQTHHVCAEPECADPHFDPPHIHTIRRTGESKSTSSASRRPTLIRASCSCWPRPASWGHPLHSWYVQLQGEGRQQGGRLCTHQTKMQLLSATSPPSTHPGPPPSTPASLHTCFPAG